jgi:hypothetical protein
LTIQSTIGGPNARVPIHRLFVKVFLWFWLTVLALFAIFFASRTLGSRLLPATDVIAAFAPRVADEAAHAYEFGGPQEFEQFQRGLMGNSEGELYLIDGYGRDVLSRPIPGISGMQTAQYLPKSQRPGIRQKMKDAAKPLREPNKLQRLRQAAITSLPYHPEYLDQGTIFDATLLDPIRTPTPLEPAEIHPPLGDNYLHLRLLTPLKSEMIARGTALEAAVSRPYYNSDHVLLYPAGTKLEGTVAKADAAGWMKKNGELLFSFHSAQTPDGTTTDMIATVAAIQAAGGQRLAVGLEGNVRATTSLFSRLRGPLSLVGPSRAVADSSVDKTAWSRAGQGSKGLGLLGAGAAQASAATAIGFGYFGGAVKIYDAFLAKGSNVELPVNTPVFLRINERAQLSSLGNPQTVVMSAGVGKP